MSDLMTRGVIMMPLELAMSSDLSRMQFHSRAQDLLVERDTYRDLCSELTNALHNHYWNDCTKHSRSIEALIYKAKSILGDKNGTSN